MLRGLLIRWVVLAIAFAITSALLHGMEIHGGVFAYLWIAAIFGVINAVLGTILKILTLPLTIITLGFFALLINASMLWLTAQITSHLTFDSFWWTTIWAALIISVVDVMLHFFVGAARPND
jgi:putative membrane protein